MLRVDDDSADINEALHSAMVLYKKKGSRAAMCLYVVTCENSSSADVCGLMQFALEHQACVSFEQMRICKIMWSFFADRDINNVFASEWQHVKQWADEPDVRWEVKRSSQQKQWQQQPCQHRCLADCPWQAYDL